MTTTTHLFVPRKSLLAAAMAAGAVLLLLPSEDASAGFFGRALNPQPLRPGLASPYHPGPIASQARTPLNVHPSSRRVCVAWGRVCVKAGRGTETHPAPCEQFEYVCRKYA